MTIWMPHRLSISCLLWMGALFCGLGNSVRASEVLTRSYNNARTGAVTGETELTPRGIAKHGMVRCFSLRLTGDDPRIEAQPLVASDVLMNDGRRHDVVYVCSMSNNVWAFDASSGAPLWRRPVNLGPPFLPNWDDPVDPAHINRSFGIMSTPVIDRRSNTMYVLCWVADKATHKHRRIMLHALRLADGCAVPKKPPIVIEWPIHPHPGDIRLSPVQKQRAALLLVPLYGKPGQHKMLYLATTGSETLNGDGAHSLHGWVIAVDVHAWRIAAGWVSTPSSFGGGIWQAGQGPAADIHGNVYCMTANGGHAGRRDFNGITDFAESFVKLHYLDQGRRAALELVDWFAPFRDTARHDYGAIDYNDQDLGSSGPILPPGTDLLLGAGKDGVLYALDRNRMGKAVADFSKLTARPRFFTFDPAHANDPKPANSQYAKADAEHYLDFVPVPGFKTHHQHSTPVVWKSALHGRMLFTWGENENLRAYALHASGRTELLARGDDIASARLAKFDNPSFGGMSGGMITVSSNGRRDGVVWATAPIDGDANQHAVPGVVRAYDAARFGPARRADHTCKMRKLWEETGFTFSKFCPPVVANGKLFIPTYDGRVDVYRLGPRR